MTDCQYLDHKVSHCRGCSGYFCTAGDKRKKLSDIKMCRDDEEWVDCPRHLSTLSHDVRKALAKSAPSQKLVKTHLRASVSRKRCPYLGPMPNGECCGNWCYGVGRYLKLAHKTCGSGWLDCGRYQKGFENKVKFYGGK